MAQAMFTTHNSGVKSARQHIPTVKTEKEAIHSGQFMVSHFVADEQDEEDDVSVPVAEHHDVVGSKSAMIVPKMPMHNAKKDNHTLVHSKAQPVCIENSLSNLFKCMSLAYRQKLTSPKWNRFRGIRLRWKEKIRLNNVIWRCWHMQFIKRENTLICQFASPLDSDTHNKPEAVVLEGKYWKRKLAAVTAEYKKCRMFYRNKLPGPKEDISDVLTDLDLAIWDSNSNDMHMLVDEDYMEFMTDTLFSTITNQPFQFPDSREMAKAGLADFIQPSLGPLQPNLDDFYMDTFDAYQEGKLTTVLEQPEYFQEQGLIQSYSSDSNLLQSNNSSIHQSNAMAVMQHQMKLSDLPQSLQPQQQHYSVQLLDNTFRLHAPPPYQPQQTNLQQSQTPRQLQQSSELHGHPPQREQQSQKSQQQQHRKAERQRTMSLQSEFYAKGYQNYDVPGSVTEFVGAAIDQMPLNQMNYKQQNQDVVSASTGYKFAAPMAPNIKFTSQQNSSDNNFKMPARQMSAPMLLNRSPTITDVSTQPEPLPPTKVGRPRGRPRSRSNTRETVKKQPLLSASSDPSLVPQQRSGFLLTQLLSADYDAGSALRQTLRNSNSNIHIKEENAPLAILPHPVPTTLFITTPSNKAQTHISEPLILNTNNSLDVSSQCLHSPTSSHSSSIGSPNREVNRDIRRAGHIHAEQKRRYNIKNGFDMLHSLIPQLNQNPNAKLSKAAMLQKGAEYIKQLRVERCQLKDEMDSLKQQIDSLNTSISNCQSLLPATGAPVSRRQDNQMQEMFEQYVRRRTLEDWKFWIFSLLFRPLLLSFNNFVSTSSLEDLYRTTIVWIEQHCTLVDLRPVVLNSLRYLCTKTDILADPDKLPGEAREAVLTPSVPSQSSLNVNTKQL